MFSFVLSEAINAEEIVNFAITIMEGLRSFIPGIEFKNKKFMLNGTFLNETAFNEIIIILFKMLKKEKIIINEDDDEFTKRDKKNKLRIQRIKRNPKDKKEGDKDSTNNMLASIIYEFPQYTLEDLFELNIYTIYYLFGYVGKIANYEVSKIAAGNGNLKKSKKHKYFAE